MKHRDDIEKRVEETLNSLDGIKRASPQPWLFTRIRARLSREEAEEKTVWTAWASFLSKPAVVLAGLCLILLFNGALLLTRPAIPSAGIAVQNELPENESFIASGSSFDFENLVQP